MGDVLGWFVDHAHRWKSLLTERVSTDRSQRSEVDDSQSDGDERDQDDESTAVKDGGEQRGDRPTQSDRIGLTDVETSVEMLVHLGLTESEYVVRFLEAHDGKAPQQTFVEQLAWSKSKISRLFQRLEDDERIVRVSLGAEKIVYLPEQAPGRDPFSHVSVDGPQIPPTERGSAMGETAGDTDRAE